MKYIILIGDGMADFPVDDLQGKTPLQAADTPNMDYLAAYGELIQTKTIPQDFAPGSDVAGLSIMGYDPAASYTGRAPLEAASFGLRLRSHEVAFRCNMVNVDFTCQEGFTGSMRDFTAGHISSTEAHKLINDLNLHLGNSSIQFYPGVSYRHLLVWANGPEKANCTPPHDIIGQNIDKYLPRGKGWGNIIKLMKASRKILETNPINQRRIKQGKPVANSIWLW